MSYRPNQSQQLSIFDRNLRLTERERKCLEKSWEKVFSDEIFPAIDEDRFRRRCYEYERLNGVDLFHDCVCDLSGKIAKMIGISSRIKRMDSLMIEANIRNLSRIELLYTCVARLVQYHHKNQTGVDLAGLEHYLAPDD